MSAIRKFFHEVGDGASLALQSIKAYYYYPKLTLFLVMQPCLVVILSVVLNAALSYYNGMPIKLWPHTMQFAWASLEKSLLAEYGIALLLQAIVTYASKLLTIFLQVWLIYTLIAYFQNQKASLLISVKQTFQRIGTLMVYAALLMLTSFIPSYSYTVSHATMTPTQIVIFGMLLLSLLPIFILVYALFFFIYPVIACEKISIPDAIGKSIRMGIQNIGLIIGFELVTVACFALVTSGMYILMERYHVIMEFNITMIASMLVPTQLVYNVIYFSPTIAATGIYSVVHHKPAGIFSQS